MGIRVRQSPRRRRKRFISVVKRSFLAGLQKRLLRLLLTLELLLRSMELLLGRVLLGLLRRLELALLGRLGVGEG